MCICWWRRGNFIYILIYMLTTILHFFTKNISHKQIVIKNTIWLLMAECMTKWVSLILTFRLAKEVNIVVFGDRNFMTVIAGFAVLFVDLWLQQLYIRDVIAKKYSSSEHIVHSMILKWIASLTALSVVFVSSFFVDRLHAIRIELLILLCYTILYNINDYLLVAFRAVERMEYEATIKILFGWLLFSCFAWYFILANAVSLYGVSLLYTAISLLQCIVTFCLLWKYKYIVGHHTILKYTVFVDLRRSSQLILTSWLCYYGFVMIDQFILGIILWHADDQSLYSSTYRIIQIIWFLVTTILAAYIPRALLWWTTNFKHIHVALWVVSLLFLWVMYFFGWTLLELLYTSEYREAYRILCIQSIWLLFILQNSFYQQLRIIQWKEKQLAQLFWCIFIASMIWQYVAISQYGMYGAAWMMCIVQWVLYMLFRFRK